MPCGASELGGDDIVTRGTFMSDTSRRGFLAIAGVGAAGVAVASVAGTEAVTSNGAAASPATALPAGASGSLVAYVSDVSNGQVSVLVGETEVQITDHELVARLAQAAGTASKKAGA
jgi:hypothetical protein